MLSVWLNKPFPSCTLLTVLCLSVYRWSRCSDSSRREVDHQRCESTRHCRHHPVQPAGESHHSTNKLVYLDVVLKQIPFITTIQLKVAHVLKWGVRCSFMVESTIMVRWVIGSIPYGGPIEIFLGQPVLHDWCNKGWGDCYPVCGMVHIK